jgi:hypothetical protein
MDEDKVKNLIDECVDLKILRRSDIDIGVDPDFHTFFNSSLNDVVASMPETYGSMSTQVEDNVFLKILAVIIIKYTKITDVQRIIDLTTVSNRVFKALNTYGYINR